MAELRTTRAALVQICTIRRAAARARITDIGLGAPPRHGGTGGAALSQSILGAPSPPPRVPPEVRR
jgi:hypothetical protein